MVQFVPSELFALAASGLTLIHVLVTERKVAQGADQHIIFALVSFFLYALFTNLEEVVLPGFFNLIEHTALGMGGLLLCLACFHLTGRRSGRTS